MIFHDFYAEIPVEEVARFVASQELGRLITVGEDGTPHIGLYPFVGDAEVVDLHLVREDELTADLKVRPRCVFEVDEVLGVIPSYWVSAEYGGSATAYHRTVIFECQALVVEDPAAVAEQQVLAAKGVTGARLSCQIICDHDMRVRAISRLAGSGRPDPGPTPAPEITPPPQWVHT